jgi:hypothetical protein
MTGKAAYLLLHFHFFPAARISKFHNFRTFAFKNGNKSVGGAAISLGYTHHSLKAFFFNHRIYALHPGTHIQGEPSPFRILHQANRLAFSDEDIIEVNRTKPGRIYYLYGHGGSNAYNIRAEALFHN